MYCYCTYREFSIEAKLSQLNWVGSNVEGIAWLQGEYEQEQQDLVIPDDLELDVEEDHKLQSSQNISQALHMISENDITSFEQSNGATWVDILKQ